MNVTDIFSKYAFVVALKKKDSKRVVDAFDKIILDEKRKPFKLHTDKGNEFINRTLRAKLGDWGIQFYVSQNEDIKASAVECHNCTLKTEMWKYFTHRNTYKFAEVLQDIVYSYNRTHYRMIGRKPKDVNADNSAKVCKRMYDSQLQQRIQPKLEVGQKIRISKTRRTFGKGYLPNWTEEIFTLDKTVAMNPPTKNIVDYDGEPVEGSFYDRELQQITKTNEVFKIEKIFRTKNVGEWQERNISPSVEAIRSSSIRG